MAATKLFSQYPRLKNLFLKSDTTFTCEIRLVPDLDFNLDLETLAAS